MSFPSAYLVDSVDIVRQIQFRTGRRIRDLAVELEAERVVVHGHASSYYIKQLAQHGVQDLLPDAPLVNAIVVETH